MHQAIYVRTSTRDQDGAAQLHALRRAAKARGWAPEPLELVDLGHSGAAARRPALDRLRALARAGELGTVLVAGLDRLGRSLRDLLALLDELAACGCAVVSLREGVDLSTPAGRLQVQLLAALAEFERALIAERVAAGLARAKSEGTRSGRPIGRAERDFDEALARELRAKGRSWRAIAQAVHAPRETVRRRLEARLENNSFRDTLPAPVGEAVKGRLEGSTSAGGFEPLEGDHK